MECIQTKLKKVRYDLSGSIALKHHAIPEHRELDLPNIDFEGYLVDECVVVQKPSTKHGTGWRIAIYPSGFRIISFEFESYRDALACAEEISALNIQWGELLSAEKPRQSKEWRRANNAMSAISERHRPEVVDW